MIEMNLNGDFELYLLDGIQRTEIMRVKVPCNLEIELLKKEGIDVHAANNVYLTQKYEGNDYLFRKVFRAEACQEAYFEFERVDIYAEYYLNGVKIGETDNALIEHKIPTGKALKDGENVLEVILHSARNFAYREEFEPNHWACLPENFETLYMRKPAHSSGWDIMPRTMLGGIVGSVTLVYPNEVYFNDVYLGQKYADSSRVELHFFYDYHAPADSYGKYRVKISMKCGNSVHEEIFNDDFKANTHFVSFNNPVLWYPNGVGKQNLYDVTVCVLEGDTIKAEKKFRYGIRSIRLDRTQIGGANGKFDFMINGHKVKLMGANWIPLSVFHSEDDALLEQTVKSAAEIGCNVLRVWGGGVYEKDRFYELCDEYGILVWQDFMLSCHVYPQDKRFSEMMEKEAISVIKRLHNHCCIALYCGGNEMDWSWRYADIDPNKDVLTRKLLPELILRFDPYREYIACTPEYTSGFIKEYGIGFIHSMDEVVSSRTYLPDDHFWWYRRDFRKVEIAKHNFISESGFSSAPNKENIVKYLGEDFAPVSMDNPLWKSRCFATEGSFTSGTELLFGEVPDDADEFILATQVYQGEAYKKYIEFARLNDKCGGMIIWVLKDSWFEYGSGVIDAAGGKKLACKYMKAAQSPVQILIGDDGEAYLSNNTTEKYDCKYQLKSDADKIIAEGKVESEPFSLQRIGKVKTAGIGIIARLIYGEGAAQKTVYNHKILCGFPCDRKKYTEFIRKAGILN